MPAVSKAQQRYLYAKFGAAWVHQHHFDNPTKGEPEHVVRKKHAHKRLSALRAHRKGAK